MNNKYSKLKRRTYYLLHHIGMLIEAIENNSKCDIKSYRDIKNLRKREIQ